MDFLSQSHMSNTMDFGLLGSVLFPRGWGTAVGVSAVLCSEAVHAGDAQSMAEIGAENWGLRQAGRWESESNLYTYIWLVKVNSG